jgi:hypothetical protein
MVVGWRKGRAQRIPHPPEKAVSHLSKTPREGRHTVAGNETKGDPHGG